MKKVLCLLLVAVCFISLFGCAMSGDRLVREAEKIIKESEVKSKSYIATFDVEITHESGEDYLFVRIDMTDVSYSQSDYLTGMEGIMGREIREEIHPQIQELVEGTNYGTMFVVLTASGRYVCSYVNGEYVSLG